MTRAARTSTGSVMDDNRRQGDGSFMEVFCGIDWAEDHHDIALAGADGKLLARRRISDDAAGLAALLELLAPVRKG